MYYVWNNNAAQQNSETGKTVSRASIPSISSFALNACFLLPAVQIKGLTHPNCCPHHLYCFNPFSPHFSPHIKNKRKKRRESFMLSPEDFKTFFFFFAHLMSKAIIMLLGKESVSRLPGKMFI